VPTRKIKKCPGPLLKEGDKTNTKKQKANKRDTGEASKKAKGKKHICETRNVKRLKSGKEKQTPRETQDKEQGRERYNRKKKKMEYANRKGGTQGVTKNYKITQNDMIDPGGGHIPKIVTK